MINMLPFSKSNSLLMNCHNPLFLRRPFSFASTIVQLVYMRVDRLFQCASLAADDGQYIFALFLPFASLSSDEYVSLCVMYVFINWLLKPDVRDQIFSFCNFISRP